MLEKREIFSLEILPMGQIQILKQTQIVEDGQTISTQNWRTVLEPGDFEKAQELLPEHEISIINAAWTEQKISVYQEWKKQQDAFVSQ